MASGGSQMVINAWDLLSPAHSGQMPLQYKLLLNGCPTCGVDLMVPTPSGGFGDLTNAPGEPGQSNPTPLEKVFTFHFIVQVPIASGDQYYDPSYGFTYPSAGGFESTSVAGYAAQINPDTMGNYHFRVSISPPLQVNVTFTPLAAFSM